MSRFRRLARVVIGVCSTIVLLGASDAAISSGFSDAFRNFVLGSQAGAGTSPAVHLPATSQANNCMRCHDGSAGPQITLKRAGATMQFRGHLSIDHPVGMNYSGYAFSNPQTYVTPARMDARIVLENGNVTCVSCHQIENGAPARSNAQTGIQRCNVGAGYTTGANRTRLCMGCHNI